MRRVAMIAVALAAAGCQTAAEERAPDVERLIAARQGEEVQRVCFASRINGWNQLGEDSLLIRKGADEWYKLDLSGSCEPEWASNLIGIDSRPTGSCLRRGDRLTTDDPLGGRCFIDAIYEWDEDAPVEVEEAEEQGAG